MGKKSILFIIPSLSAGGAERQSVTVARLLSKQGYRVKFLTYFKGCTFLELLEESGVAVETIECKGLKRIVIVANYIRRGKFDVVISFMQTPNFLNNFTAFLGKKWKVITSIRATPRQEEIKSLQGKIFGWFYRKSDSIVCNSNNTLAVFGNIYPNCKEKLKTIYNAVSFGNISSKYMMRKNDRINIVVAATVSRIKNPINLLNALSLLNESEKRLLHIDWYGKQESVIGDHSEYDKVVDMRETMHLQDVITLHDSTNEIASIMCSADCVALFSRLEGLPNAICEGMMLGKPIIMSRCSDYNVLVEEGRNGFLCDWDNPNSIKESLLKMARLDNLQLQEMGNFSKAKALNLFSESAITREWVSVIEG